MPDAHDGEWRCSVFSDESRFCITMDVRHVCVWRCRGERTKPADVVERQTGVTPCLMVWGAIGNILCPHVLSLLRQNPGTVFQQDNTHPHTARVSMDCLRHVEVLSWPARSPDLSPIEQGSCKRRKKVIGRPQERGLTSP
uniref:Tc1-like transposase DDE domain-containing protein n=1 Tax=Paramormyrops kingsleyae TaxID=1676925 RepID=A0A3B3RER8_9TELE